MKIFVAGGTGAIGRPLIAQLLAKGHALVALTRSPEKAQSLVEQGIEPAIADVFDTNAVKTVVSRTQPEVVIEQLTALPRTYTPESMRAAALNNRIRLEGGANVLAAAQAAGVRRYLRQSVAFYAIPGPGLADEDTPLAFSASPAVAAGAREVTELEHRLLGNPNIEVSSCVMVSSMDPAPGSTPMAMLPDRCDSNSSRSSGMAKASGRGYTLRTRRLPPLRQQSKAILEFI
jgi:NAD(P)-dependent dehydrogenase (short-subunit alcohol dehydrogenase family)